MNMYNMINGVNGLAAIVLAILKQTPSDFPRFRDAYIRDGELVVLTRTGGGNREEYEAENESITEHPLYLRDQDDDFDCTYAEWFFKIPDEFAELKNAPDEPTLQAKFEAALERLEQSNKEQDNAQSTR